METSPKNTLDKNDIKPLLIKGLIVILGALLPYLTQVATQYNFGSYTLIVQVVLTVGGLVLHQLTKDNTSEPPMSTP